MLYKHGGFKDTNEFLCRKCRIQGGVLQSQWFCPLSFIFEWKCAVLFWLLYFVLTGLPHTVYEITAYFLPQCTIFTYSTILFQHQNYQFKIFTLIVALKNSHNRTKKGNCQNFTLKIFCVWSQIVDRKWGRTNRIPNKNKQQWNTAKIKCSAFVQPHSDLKLWSQPKIHPYPTEVETWSRGVDFHATEVTERSHCTCRHGDSCL